MSTSVFGLPISFEECRTRVADALAAEDYGNLRDLGNGWLGFTGAHSASVGCIHGRDETVLTVVVASEGQNVEQRDRLAALIRDGGTPASRHLPPELVVPWSSRSSTGYTRQA